MKLNKIILIGAALMAGALFTGCQNSFDEPDLAVPVATMKPNTTIAELKTAFWSDDTNYATLCEKKADGSDYIIRGRVISSDAASNVYKSLYIQDETGAVTLSVNQSQLYTYYKLGQEVVFRVTGSYIGKYAGLQQIGGEGSYNGTPQVTFMTLLNLQNNIEKNGLPTYDVDYINYGDAVPESGNMYCIKTDIATLNSIAGNPDELKKMQSQLVELDNVHFEDAGKATYATEKESVSRNIVDEQGNVLIMRSSGYATFWSETLPEGVGKVRGLLGYYNGSWQLTIRSLADVIDFDTKGTSSDPYTVAEALKLENTGHVGWVKGYIVGSVKGTVKTITGNDDIIWSKNADLDNTLVIGATPDTKDLANALVMELPANSDLRSTCNLLDNPDMYGKEIKVRGTFADYLGTNGIVGNGGSTSEFWIEGMAEPGAPTPPAGSGTEADPYNVAAIIAKCEETGTTESSEAYYFAGYVTSVTEISTSFGNATFYIADTPGGTPTFYVYRISGMNNKITNPNFLKPGDYVVCKAKVVNYNGKTPESVQKSGNVISVNGSKTEPTEGGEVENPETPTDLTGDGTVDSPYDVASIIKVAQAAGTTGTTDQVYFTGYVTKIKEISTQYGNATFWIADKEGGSPTFYVYRVKGFNNKKVTDPEIVKVGDKVVIHSKVMNYSGDTPETVQNDGYIYSVNGATE